MRAPRLSDKNSSTWALLAAGAAAAVVLCTFLIFGQPSGHDIDFHLASWMDAALQWRHGVIFPRWAAWANLGYGEPRFIFYPPLSWWLGAALGLLLPWLMAPPAFILLSVLLAAFSMHRLVRGFVPPRGAVAAAVIYAVNPYTLVNVYLRSDYAELLASAIFPLALYYALKVADSGIGPGRSAATEKEQWRAVPAFRDVALLGIAFSMIWLSNAPAGVIATYSIMAILAQRAAQRRSLRPLLTGGFGLGLGLALAGVYIVPAALEQRWVNINQVIGAGLRFSDNFLFTSTPDPDHNLFNFQISVVAIFIVALAVIAAVASYRRVENRSMLWMPMLVLGAISTVVLFPVSGFAWKILPELRFVQFPWRWLFPLAVALAFFLGAVVAQSRQWLAVSVLLIVLWVGSGLGVMARAFWNSDEAPDAYASIVSGRGYDGTDEYATLGVDRTDLPQKAPPVALLVTSDNAGTASRAASASVAIESWEPERKVFAVDSPGPVRAVLRLLYYPAWQAIVNGRAVQPQYDHHTGQMWLALSGGRSQVEMRFGRTADRVAGDAISAVALLAVIGMLAGGRRSAAKKLV